jgi:hypothetical protein
LHERYDELFGGGGEQGSTTTSTAGFGKKWGYYQSIYTLCNGDITKFENVTKLNVNFCLTMLAFKKDKAMIEDNNIKKKFK